jgi:raffinose/stachyose/melibiose transport system substrate-binding protein
MNRKLYFVLSLVLILSFALASCAAPATPTPAAEEPAAPVEPTAEEPAAPAEPAAEEPAAEKVTITWWHIQVATDQKELWQKTADAYMADHPNVNIEITVLENEAFKTKLTTVMQSGNPPHIFQSWGGGGMNEYVKAGLLKDITAELDKDGWRDTFFPGALGVWSFEGKNYGVPRDMGAVGFWYNKDLFKKAGIENPPTTWTELMDDAKKLKDAGITPFAVGGGDKWPAAFWWEYLAVRLGGKAAFDAAYSRTGSFADAPFVEAGKKLKEVVDAGYFQDGFLAATWPDEQVVMASEKAAMDLMGQWAPGAFKDADVNKVGLGDKLGWFPFPAVEGGAGDPADALGGGNGWVVGKDAPPEAIDFLKYISSAESQIEQAKIGLSVPVVKGAESGLSDPNLIAVQKGAAAAKYFQLYYDQALDPGTGSVVNDSVQGIMAGTMTPEQAAQAIEDSFAEYMKK